MKGTLVIVESPAKARTIGRILGSKYLIKASLGHVRDLPRKTLGIDVNKDFKPEYHLISQRKKVVSEIKDAATNVNTIYLATDPDREGEAISWHLVEAARLDQIGVPIQRVVFHEITDEAVKKSFENPRAIDMDLVYAQQARRLLDRLVGYKLSPLLWKKVLKGLSAGRVQSAAVRIIVDREREILSFAPEEYWTIKVALAQNKEAESTFRAKLFGTSNRNQLTLSNQKDCDDLVEILSQSEYRVYNILQKRISRQPSPPFTTSTMQQEAWRRLRFTAKHTMAIAQQLYEGIPVGEEGNVGLITYMRTDSTHVASSVLHESRDYIKDRYGDNYLPAKPRIFSRKSKFTQEAHEAIRPTKIFREPEKIRSYLKPEQYKLYELIWKRMVASQISEALYDNVIVDIIAKSDNGDSYLLKATSSKLKFPGFITLYMEARDEEEAEDSEALPVLEQNEILKLINIFPEKNITEPPPRYNEATLIKALEQKGIGRPSTYAPIISTIQEREYVYKTQGRFKPGEIGFIVNDILIKYFPNIIDFSFTAQIENDLDLIASGKKDWVSLLKDFYIPFNKLLTEASSKIVRINMDKQADVTCPDCGKPMLIKHGRFGKFLSCSGYPECKKTMKYVIKIGIPCPICGNREKGELIQRQNKKRRIFYGCSRYPDCNFVTNYKPLPQPCPNCGKLLVQQHKDSLKCTSCEYKGSLNVEKINAVN